ncbi:MAG: hypothetical protein QM796_10835 [Chthoniobacteraceae bacterium]
MFLVWAILYYPAQGPASEIAFFYAVDADYTALAAASDQAAQSVKVGSHTIARFTMGTHRIFACKMESGAVPSALSAAALLTKFHCDLAFAIGPAGGISDSATIGQWFQVTKVVAYQHGSQGSTGFMLAPNAVIVLPKSESVQIKLPQLFKDNPQWTVASGELFVLSLGFRQQLEEDTHAQAVDMNLYGLAAACADYQVPLYCWRIISDRADENAGEDFKTFTSNYDGSGAKAIVEIIRNLPKNPNSPASYPGLQKLLNR